MPDRKLRSVFRFIIAAAFIVICVAGIGPACRWICDVNNNAFVDRYNAAVSDDALQKFDAQAIKSLSDNLLLQPEDWAWLHGFAAKYNLDSLSSYDTIRRYDLSNIEFLDALKSADAYVIEHDIPPERLTNVLESLRTQAEFDLIGMID